MLDIIIDSVSFDFANIFNLCSVTQLYAKGAVSGENTLASDFAAMNSSMKVELKRLAKIYGKSAE